MYILKTERVRTTYKMYCNVCKTGEFMEDSWEGGEVKHSVACSLSLKNLYIKGTLWIFLTNKVLFTFSSSHQGVSSLCTVSIWATKTVLSSSCSICLANFSQQLRTCIIYIHVHMDLHSSFSFMLHCYFWRCIITTDCWWVESMRSVAGWNMSHTACRYVCPREQQDTNTTGA